MAQPRSSKPLETETCPPSSASLPTILGLYVRAMSIYKTPLHWAAEHDRRDVAEMLVDAGADLEATTSWGATALDWAATMGSANVADLLVARGAKG